MLKLSTIVNSSTSVVSLTLCNDVIDCGLTLSLCSVNVLVEFLGLAITTIIECFQILENVGFALVNTLQSLDSSLFCVVSGCAVAPYRVCRLLSFSREIQN